jgi:hypothetical protein
MASYWKQCVERTVHFNICFSKTHNFFNTTVTTKMDMGRESNYRISNCGATLHVLCYFRAHERGGKRRHWQYWLCSSPKLCWPTARFYLRISRPLRMIRLIRTLASLKRYSKLCHYLTSQNLVYIPCESIDFRNEAVHPPRVDTILGHWPSCLCRL